MIKLAFNDILETDEDEDEENIKGLTDKDIIDRIRKKFRKKVLLHGPSIMNQS